MNKKVDFSQLGFINENNKKVIENDRFYEFKMGFKRRTNNFMYTLSSLFDVIFKPKYTMCKYYDDYFKSEKEKGKEK